ncbi:UNVERIFIED_CONTAM: hypothetical protein Slati_2132500 [Sesamum latifolium]|uniref:Uncharacterized protein n=1 Tax=Sesamum latifolium TaxID=2727402 RepID=A0AAW2WRG3_9LAMI
MSKKVGGTDRSTAASGGAGTRHVSSMVAMAFYEYGSWNDWGIYAVVCFWM